MTHSKRSIATAGLALTVGMAMTAVSTAAIAQAPVMVQLDSETTIGGIGVGCTGIGQTKDQERWLAYPVRVEFAEGNGNYEADEFLTLSDAKGSPLFTVHCGGPWVLLKLPAGVGYRVEGRLTEKGTSVRNGTVKAPEHGQKRFVLTFPKAY
jgi:hypothetical protein